MPETLLSPGPETAPVSTTTATPAPATISEAPPVGASPVQGDGTPVGVTTPSPAERHTTVDTATWRDTLPLDLQNDPNIKNFKDLTTFAKSHVELRKTLGDKVSIPKESDPEDVKQAFREKLGIPKVYDSKVYNVKGPELPDGMALQDTEVENFARLAHTNHLTPNQTQAILNYYGDIVKGALPNYKADMESAKSTLQDDWGAAVDRNMGLARRALYADFPKETAERIEKTGLANDVGFIKGMYQRGKMLVEEGVIPSEVAQGMDNKSAEREINTIMGDMNHPYYVRNHPGHQAAVDKVRSLNQLVHG